jgi:NACHT domain
MSKLPGESLRDSIAQLLRMKYQTVVVEKRLKTTTADVFFIDDTNQLFQRKIAIEAKDWQRGLSSKEIADIYNLYAPSLINREVDFLWIIGRNPLLSSPQLSVESLMNVIYSTFDEFQASLMNFTGLLRNNIVIYQHDDAFSDFIETRVRDRNETLLHYVTGWLESDYSGLIIYGGYGLGKTTFSLYLASLLSQKYLDKEFRRIPIRISLSGMYSKQDLVALICSTLGGGDGGTPVRDFSYGLFLEMNRTGQYLLILDGFDEMRHAMDLDDFVYIFEQIKPLFRGQAKIIILGRPDSFLSSEEEAQVLLSLVGQYSDISSKVARVEVSFFSKQEVLRYLNSYISRRSIKLTTQQMENYDSLISKLPDSELDFAHFTS